MDDTPDLSTLPQRMRYASQVMEEAAEEYHRRYDAWLFPHWQARHLPQFADQWEAEDRHEADERQAQIDSLAEIIEDRFRYHTASAAITARGAARKAIEVGWRNSGVGESIA